MEKPLPLTRWFEKINATRVFFVILGYQFTLLIWFHTLYGIDPFVRLLGNNHLIVRHWLPLFQSLLWIYFSITQSDIGLLILMSFIAAGACALFYKWVLIVFDQRVALVSVLFVAFYPLFLIISRAPYIEGLALLLIAATLYLFEKQHWKSAWIIYLLACLTRTESFALSAIFALRFWQLYGFQKSIRYTLLFSLPSMIGLGIFLYIMVFPSTAFNPATHAIIQKVHFDWVQMTHQLAQFAFDSHVFIFILALCGITLLLYEKKWHGAYVLLPILFLIHGLLNGTSCGCYFPRTMLLAYVFFAPFFSYAILRIYYSYSKMRMPILVFLGIFLIFNIVAGIVLLNDTDKEARPWRDSGMWLESHFEKNAHILVLPVYDSTGLNWSSWRYIAPLYFSRFSLEKNITIDQENKNTLAYQREILSGRFDGVVVSEHNIAALAATKELTKLNMIQEVAQFPEEFHVFGINQK